MIDFAAALVAIDCKNYNGESRRRFRDRSLFCRRKQRLGASAAQSFRQQMFRELVNSIWNFYIPLADVGLKIYSSRR